MIIPSMKTIEVSQWRTQEKFRGGVQGRGSGLVGGPGAEPPKKMAKNAVFSPILQKNFKTMRSIFARLDEKHDCLGNFEKFLMKIQWKN